MDVLSELLEFRWRDVPFPVTEFTTELHQDLVEHKWPDRDGAHVEATGRAPLVITATIPFLNGIAQGPSENWKSFVAPNASGSLESGASLYPTVFRAFFVAMATRSSGPLQHPEFGIIQCKPKSAVPKWGANRRDGCMVTASWVESLDDTVQDFQDILARKSPVPDAFTAAADLDQQIVDYAKPSVTSDSTSLSFSDQIQNITSAFDAVTMAQYQYAGQIDSVVYRVQSLQSRVTAAADVTAWPIVSSCERCVGALYDLKALLLTSERSVLYYTAKQDTTLAAVAVDTKSDMGDLLTLNPALVQNPYVPEGAIVRYYG